MPLYQGEPDALAYFDSYAYTKAVGYRQTWSHTHQVHNYDDVCRTEMYSLKTEEWHEWENCECYGAMPSQITSVKWSKTAENHWLRRGFVPTHGGVLRKHYRWADKHGFQNQVIKEDKLCPA